MALRFTDTGKWEDDWFISLSPIHKLIHQYLTDKCDVAGIWKISMADLKFRTGGTENDWTSFLAAAGRERIVILPGQKNVWLVKFIPFQNPRGLTVRNPVTGAIAKSLVRFEIPWHLLPSPYEGAVKSLMSNSNIGAIEGLSGPLGVGAGNGSEGERKSETIGGDFPPTLAEFRKHASGIGIKPADVDACYHHHAAAQFMRNGTPLTGYKSLLAKWAANARQMPTNGRSGARSGAGGTGASDAARRDNAARLRLQISDAQSELDGLREAGGFEKQIAELEGLIRDWQRQLND